VIHAEDATGSAIGNTLADHVKKHQNIQVFENYIGVDLITGSKLNLLGNRRCLGLYVLDKNDHKIKVFAAKFVVLATGGAGKVYCTPAIPMLQPAMVLQWRGGRVVG
jgi:L-aspartate oxidase